MTKFLLAACFLVVSLSSSASEKSAYANEKVPEYLAKLQTDWAKANYDTPLKDQTQAFTQLLDQLNQVQSQHPKDTQLLVWSGIIKSSYAGVKGGLGALALVKEAKRDFEAAIRQDPHALQGSAYTSLGYLYAKVPGWPIGFGDDKKAAKLLQQGLSENPTGIDSNYFYGLYWLDKKEYEQASTYLHKAQMAAPRSDRPLADSGRQKEISIALNTIDRELRQR